MPPELETHRTNEMHCPHCSACIDTHSSLESGQSPDPGKFSICMYCGNLNTIVDRNGKVGLAKYKLEEFFDLPFDTQAYIARMVMVVKQAAKDPKRRVN